MPLSLDPVEYGDFSLSETESASIGNSNELLRKTTAIHMLCYADDVCLIAHKRDMPLLVQLVEDFSNIYNFKWNPEKCCLINYSSSRRPISIYNIPLPIADSYNYLGIPMTVTGVDVNAMLNISTRKAKATMQLMRRIGVHQYGYGLFIALKIYRVFVRPIMEFAVAILGLNATTGTILDKTQAKCLNMTLNRSETLNAPPQALNIMACLPSLTTRVQILTFWFQYRLKKFIPSFSLLSCLAYTHSKDRYAPLLWKRFEKNKLWLEWSAKTTFHPDEIINSFIEKEILKWCNKKPSSKRANRDTKGYDPILYYPCTNKERLRLIKWRLHWLPSFPLHTCRCGELSAKRNHYLSCPLMNEIITSLILKLPDDFQIEEDLDDNGAPTTHLLDRVLCILPPKISDTHNKHWESTWPLILRWINAIDWANHPEGTFDDDLNSGDLYRDYLTRNKSSRLQRLK